jgi:hypothetical protein
LGSFPCRCSFEEGLPQGGRGQGTGQSCLICTCTVRVYGVRCRVCTRRNAFFLLLPDKRCVWMILYSHFQTSAIWKFSDFRF